jgi:AraC family transcriptional regulator, regulatory protein of adaptative response / methylphosphotriester-DNA alkyltransferase methyltransferase
MRHFGAVAIRARQLRVLLPDVSPQRPATKSLRRSLYEEATRIVNDEYAADLELDEVARRVASSRRQIQRVFAEVGHTTFREHLARVRMDRAAELLASGGPTVREVAARVGYRQPAQFAKAFRRHRGQAPAAYRAERLRARNGGPPRT